MHGRPFYVDAENPDFRGLAQQLIWQQMHPDIEKGERVRSNCVERFCCTPDHLVLVNARRKPASAKQKSFERDASVKANREFDKLIRK